MPVGTRSEQRRKRKEFSDDWHFHGTGDPSRELTSLNIPNGYLFHL